MKMFSCVVFDLDGTLTQTNDLIFATFNHVAEKYTGRTYTPAEIIAMFGPPEEIAVERIVGPDRVKEALRDFYAFYEHRHDEMASIHEGVPEVLAYLREHGFLLAVFTGKGRLTTLTTLEKFHIKRYFDMIVTGTDVNNHKPSGEGITKVMKAFSLEPGNVLMVGDAVADIKAARDAGVSVAAVLWDSYGKDRVLQMDADFVFHTVLEFEEWVRSSSASSPRRMGE